MYTPPVATSDRAIERGLRTGRGGEGGMLEGWRPPGRQLTHLHTPAVGSLLREVARAGWLRGGISRNKVAVGEPAAGSCSTFPTVPPVRDWQGGKDGTKKFLLTGTRYRAKFSFAPLASTPVGALVEGAGPTDQQRVRSVGHPPFTQHPRLPGGGGGGGGGGGSEKCV